MPLLPTLEEQHRDTAETRLGFLENIAKRAGELATSLAPASDLSLPAEAALTEAAALAFATERTPTGKAFLDRVRNGPESGQGSLLRRLTAMAVVAPEAISLRPEGILTIESPDAVVRPWAAPAPVMQASAGTLLAATLSSGRSAAHFQLLHRSAKLYDAGRLAQLTIATCAEAATLPLFGMNVDDDGLLNDAQVTQREEAAAFTSFLALHDRYAAAIRLNRADSSRWEQLRCRAPLIDWPLLLLHLALRRHAHTAYPIDETRTDLAGRLAVFLRGLAGEIDGDTAHGGQGGPGGGAGPGYRIELDRYGAQTQGSAPNLRSGIAGAD